MFGNGSFGEIGFGEDQDDAAVIAVIPGTARVVGKVATLLGITTVRVIPGTARVVGKVADILGDVTIRLVSPGTARIVGSTPRIIGLAATDVVAVAFIPVIGPLVIGTPRVGMGPRAG